MRAATANYIRLDYGHTVKELPCPTFEELTVDDYVRIVEQTPANNVEQPHDTIQRVFGLSFEEVVVMKVSEVEALLTFYTEWVRQGAERFNSLRTIGERLDEMANEEAPPTAERIREELAALDSIPDWFDLDDGVRYMVPQAVDVSTVWGQILDLKALTEAKNGGEVSRYARLLAIMCLPHGETFHPANVAKRVPMFGGVRMVDAMAVIAFFFSTSERFNALPLHNFPHCLAWRKRWHALARTTSTPVGEPSAN